MNRVWHLLFLLVLSGLLSLMPLDAQAAPAAENRTQSAAREALEAKKAKAAYARMLASGGRSWSFAVGCLDGDAVPELFLQDSAQDCLAIYTYRSGKLIRLRSEENLNTETVISHYYPKKGIYVEDCTGSTSRNYYYFRLGRDAGIGCAYYRYERTSVRRKLVSECYYWSRKRVVRASFEKKLGSLVGTVGKKKLCYHLNTAANRKLWLTGGS